MTNYRVTDEQKKREVVATEPHSCGGTVEIKAQAKPLTSNAIGQCDKCGMWYNLNIKIPSVLTFEQTMQALR
jgi:hypothetical protein